MAGRSPLAFPTPTTVYSCHMSTIALVARNTFRELVRTRVLVSMVAFALLMAATAMLVDDLAVVQLAKVTTDVGLSAMRLLGTVVAIFVGVQLVFREIERRTVDGVLARPVGRGAFVVGKFAGLALTLAACVALMALAVAAAVMVVQGGYAAQVGAVLPAAYLILLELLVTGAIALMFSTISSPFVAAVMTVVVYIAGSLSANLRALEAGTGAPEWLLAALYYLLPNPSNFSAITTAAYGAIIPTPRLAAATAYAALYCGLTLAIAAMVFERRELK
jgi:Cu-processing system permease protein